MLSILLARMDSPSGTVIAYATAPDRPSWGGKSWERNSVYTKHLLAALQTKTHWSVLDLFVTVRAQVMKETKNEKIQQKPWESVSLESRFCFGTCIKLPSRNISQQLRVCEGHFQAKRLINASKCYKHVSEKAPANEQVLIGFKKIEETFVIWIEQAIAQRQLDKAKRDLTGLRTVNPNSPMLPELKRKLQAAEAISPRKPNAEPVQMSEAPIDYSIELWERELAQKLRECDKYFQANYLTITKRGTPFGKETAFVCYNNVLKNHPGNTEASEGLEKIEARLATLIKEALDQEQLNQAGQYLARLRKMNSDSSMLPKLPLALCEKYFQADYLTITQRGTPFGKETAFVCYNNVLKNYPSNINALGGLRRIEERLVTLIKEAIKKRQRNLAKKHVASLRKVNPKSLNLYKLEKDISKIRPYRYIDNGNGTVTDNKTGLIWLKNANCFGQQTWKKAMRSAAKLAHGKCGLRDGSRRGKWRLPTIHEWKTMLDKRYRNPALSNAAGTGKWKEGNAFSGVHTNTHWSSNKRKNSTTNIWVAYVLDGRVNYRPKTYPRYVWPVRDR